MKHLFFILLLFITFDISAQVYPDEFPSRTIITSIDAVYGQEKVNGVRTPVKYYFDDIKDFVLEGLPSVIVGRDELADSISSVLVQAYAKGDSLYMITDGSELVTIVNPIQNDMAMNAIFDSLWIYGDSVWNLFSGAGGTIVSEIISTTNDFSTYNSTVGNLIKTKGFSSVGDEGAGSYLIESTGAADGMRIFATQNGNFARLINNPDGSISPLQLGAILDDNLDDRLNLQTALDNFSWVKLNSTGLFLVSDSLTYNSNQHIDFGSGIEIRASNNTKTYNLLANKGSTSNSALRTINVKISGGTWDYNGVAKTGGGATQMHQYGMIFHKIDDLIVENLTVKNCIKFAISGADLNDPIFRNIEFQTDSDGLHVMGPSHNVIIDNITGVTGDDFVAVSGSDYTANAYTEGDITNITITNIFPDSAGTEGNIIALFPGNNLTRNLVFKNVKIDNVKGISTNADIISIDEYGTVGDPSNEKATGGVVDGLDIRNIAGEAGSFQILSVHLDTIKNMVVDGLYPDSNNGKLSFGCYIDKLVLSNLNFQNSNGTPILDFENSSNVRDLVIDKMKANKFNGARYLQFESDSVGQNVTLRDCEFRQGTLGGNGHIWVNSDSLNLTLDNCYFENMNYATRIASQGVKVFINQTYYKNNNWAVLDQDATTTAEIYPNSYIFDNPNRGQHFAFDDTNAGTLTIVQASDNLGGYISASSNYTIPVSYPKGAWIYIYNTSSSAITVQASAGLVNSLVSVSLGALSGGYFKKTTPSNWNTSSSSSLGAGILGQTIYNNGSGWLASDNIYNAGANIGIGVSSLLSQKLNVNGATATTGIVKFSTGETIINSDASVGNLFQNWSSLGSVNRLDVGASSTFKTWWRSTGNIGIGKSNPLERLELDGSLYINNEGSAIIVDASDFKRFGLLKRTGDTPVFVHSNTIPMSWGMVNQASITGGTYTEQLHLSISGDFGVGVTPTEKLEVNGKAKATNLQATALVSAPSLATDANGNLIVGTDPTGDVAEVDDINSPYSLSATELTVFVDCTNGSTSVTLLQGAAMAGKRILFVRKDNQAGNSVTIIASTGSILGPVSLDSQYEAQAFVSDGTNYYAY